MRARLAIVGIGLVLAGCTGPAPMPTTVPTTPATAPTATGAPTTTPATATASAGASPTATPTTSATTTPALAVLTLSGTAIGDQPLGSTPLGRLEPQLVARLGKSKAGRTQLCRLPGDRNQFALVDRSYAGLTVHYGHRGGATLAIAWEVDLDRVPDGFRLVDRLPWRPTFTELEATGVVVVDTGVTTAQRRTAALPGRAISYSGELGSAGPDSVRGGPDFTCR
jgi:hypothetical protein